MSGVLLLDIETTHLRADFGSVLCVGYKWLGEKKVHVPSVLDYPDFKKALMSGEVDRRLVKDFAPLLTKADMLVTYFGKGFDSKFLNAKLFEYGEPFPANTPHVDLFFTVKANLALSRKSLQNVAYHGHLSAEKTPVEGRIWRRASVGHEPSIRYVIQHCRADVLILEEAYLRLRPLVRQHPRLGPDGCRACGGQITRDKIRYTAAGVVRHQYVCKNCGSYETRAT